MAQGNQPPDQSAPTGSDSSQQAAAASQMMDLTDLAPGSAQSRFDRILQWIPRILSSKPHVVALTLLGVYLVVLPLLGIAVSNKAELIGGNYTNVTSDIGACIAAGGTLHLISQSRKRMKLDQERMTILHEIHTLLHHVHPAAAAELRQVAPPGDTPPPDHGNC
jgi:hypothetical protein